MRVFFAKKILLPTGWHENVRLEIDDQGIFTAIETNSHATNAILLDSPVISGMPNLHSHCFQRVMAGLAEVAGNKNDSFWTWRDLMYRVVQNIAPDQFYHVARYLYIEMLKAGYTAVAEFNYVHHNHDGKSYQNPTEISQKILQAAKEVGIGITLLPVLYRYSGFNQKAPLPHQGRFILETDQYLSFIEDLGQHIDKKTQQLGVCFHSLRAVTQQQIEQVCNSMDSTMPVHIHISEQQKEVEECLAATQRRPIEYLFNIAQVNTNWSLIHATHANEQELQLMAKSQSVVGLCITTEANLGDGIFPTTQFLALDGQFGIGSDSHVTVSVNEELRWLEYTQRLRDQHRNRVYEPSCGNYVGDTIYQRVLKGGAQSLAQPIGQIAVGYRADFLVLDPHNPFIQTAANQDILNRWIFSSDNTAIQDVYVAGEHVIQKRQHALDDQVTQKFIQVIQSVLQ